MIKIAIDAMGGDNAPIEIVKGCDLALDAYPDKTFKGKVTEIDNTTQTYFSGTSSLSTSGTYTKVTQLVPVKVSIENNDNLPLTLGMNAIVKIKLK